MRLRILDLDDSVAAQPEMRRRLAARQAQRIDLHALAPRLRLWSTGKTMHELRRHLHAAPPPPGQGPTVTFYGSGDFHHLAPELMKDQQAPFTLVHFDNHPDWMRFAPRYHCGSWINRALAMRTVTRIITIGPCSADLDRPHLSGGNLDALATRRLEMYPWRRRPSFVMPGASDYSPHRREGWRLHWKCVREDWVAFIDQLARSLPDTPVWITIDKDVLRAEDALTNWDQGEMPFDALDLAIRRIGSTARVVGVDVCGEYSPAVHTNPFKRYEAWTDQPPPPIRPTCTVNAKTNARMLATFEEVLG